MLVVLLVFFASVTSALRGKPITCTIDGFYPGERVTATRFSTRGFRCKLGPENLVSFENRTTSVLLVGKEIIAVNGKTLRFSDGSSCAVGQNMEVAKSVLKRSGFKVDLMLDDIVRCRKVFSQDDQSVLRVEAKGGIIAKISGNL